MLDNFLNQNESIFSLNTTSPITLRSQLNLPIPNLPYDYEWDKKMGYIDDVINKAKNARTEYPGFGVTNPADPPIDPDITTFLEEYKKAQKQQLYSAIANQVGNWADALLSKDMVYGSGTQKLFNGLDALEKIPGIGTGIKVFNFGRDAVTRAWSSKIDEFDYDPTLSAYLGNSYNFEKFDKLKETNGKRALGPKLSRLNNERDEAKRQIDVLSNINNENQSRVAMRDNVGFNQLNYNTKLNGGNNNLTYIGKKGLKVELIKRAKNIKSRINTEKIEEFENGGKFEPEIINIKPEIITNKNSVTKFQKGGKTIRSLEELIKYAQQENPRFIQRLSEAPRGIEFIDDEGNKSNGSHYLEWSTDNEGNAVIYPRIQEMEDGNLKFLQSKDAWIRANKNNNTLIMSPEEAEVFFAKDPEYGTAYKRGWPKFFNTYKQYNFSDLKTIQDFYKDYDISDINLIYDSQSRTEGNNIYADSDESIIHELWHYLSQNKPNEIYKEFYDNLNDQRIQELGGDLQFVNRTGDPNEFYNPSELEARIKAAKYKTQGQNYTKDFFRELRNNPEKYGYNMRDLLYMYNDENLEKIFNLKQGGTIKESDELVKLEETSQKNVIPEGALHKNKHHIEHAEGLTQKGIPVVDDDGEQQAEIELNEIIFTLEVTKKLEELHKIFKEGTNKEKDEAAIEAGKLLVQEILYNTDDRTGLISKCQKGGKLNEFK